MLNVVETNAIASTLSISQDGNVAEVKESIGDMHIQEDGSKLTIYVPMDKKAQEFCFCSHLPAKLAAWLMRGPNTHIPEPIDNALVTSLTTLLNVDRSVVDRVLDHQGIIRIPIPDEGQDSDEEPQRSDEDSDFDLESDPDSDMKSARGSTLDATTDETGESSNDVVVLSHEPSSSTRSISASLRNSAPTRRVFRDRQLPEAGQHDLHHRPEEASYLKLLDKVLTAARAKTFPSKGTFDMSHLSSSLPAGANADGFGGLESSDLELMPSSHAKVERDRKVGAAGELYVSCLFPKLCLCLTYVDGNRYLNCFLALTPAFPGGVERIGRVPSADTPEITPSILIWKTGTGERRRT